VSTYADIARAMNNPKAVRAVGNALRHNPFAPVSIYIIFDDRFN
jgi:O6-methylguanine-DNA--protein-cysteine methyltransferase